MKVVLETGYVVETRGDIAMVRVNRNAMCTSCGKCGIAAVGERGELLVEARNHKDAAPGDWVRVEMDTSNVLLAAFMVYILPMILAALGYLAGLLVCRGLDMLVRPQTGGIVGSVVFFLSSYGILRAYDRHAKRTGVFIPIVKEIIVDDFS